MNTPERQTAPIAAAGRTAGQQAATLLAAALVAALWGVPVARADDWATLGLDAAHARHSAERSGPSFSDGRWSVTLPGGARVVASPVVADGVVITVDLDGTVHAVRANDGGLVWKATLRSAVQGTPAVAQGRLFIPTFGNKLIALRLGNGAPLWQRDLGGTMLSSPTPVGGDIVVAAGLPQRHIVRLAGPSGEVVWRSPPVMEQFSNTSPAVGEGVVVVGANGGHYYAFDLATGAPRWDHAADGIVHLASPIVAGGRVYMAGGGTSGKVHAVKAATGERLPGWPIELPAPEVDIAGTRVGRSRAVSSFSAAGAWLLLQTRLDDALDTNDDGTIDKYLSRESVVALDPDKGTLAWRRPLARAERQDPNEVPKFFVCPTPATFTTVGGAALAAIASSLEARLIVLDVATGDERAYHAVASPALASPVMANGRVVVTALNGTVEGLLSASNHPPVAPVLIARPRPLEATAVRLNWHPAVDADGEAPSYELRVDDDGEVLETWSERLLLAAGVTSARLAEALAVDKRYTFAVRARDSHGAYSPWSASGTFQVTLNPPVTVAGRPAAGLIEALRTAQAGDEIGLAEGTYILSEPLHVETGVSIRGAGAGRTRLDATGLGVGIHFQRSASTHHAGLDGVTVMGADTCIQVAGGVTGIRLSHLSAHDCLVDGIDVEAAGAAAIANATLIGNGRAVHAAGTVTIKNSLVTANEVAFARDERGELASSYNDLFENQLDYAGASPGPGDFSVAVAFADLPERDVRLLTRQPSTDQGDPSDSSGAEPTPDGERINLGAFGGTADAEQSDFPSTAITVAGSRPGLVSDVPPRGDSDPPRTAANAGCAVGGRPGERSGAAAGVLLALLLVRRPRISSSGRPGRSRC
jgi:outer membrane protein assembly factor BamB